MSRRISAGSVRIVGSGVAVKNWNEVVKEHAAGVLNAALRVTGNLADAEDIGQEVFAEAFQKFDKHPHRPIGYLLKRMAVCRAIDFLRSKKTCDALPHHLVDRNTESVFDHMAQQEVEVRLREIISELPPREAQVFCLIYFERLTNTEAAETLNVSTNLIAKSLSKARTKINERFTGVFRRD